MSNLLSQASLVMIPSGYKEDVVYSQIPTDGAGDLSFTRASNGTRINSAGLVEVCPWNLCTYSEDQTQWTSENATTVTANSTTAPNGTLTADTVTPTAVNDDHYRGIILSNYVGELTAFIYVKPNGYNFFDWGIWNGSSYIVRATFDLVNLTYTFTNAGTATIESVGNGWLKCGISGSNASLSIIDLYYRVRPTGGAGAFTGNGTSGAFIWGAQLNIGSTAKPYFPTTDRLNVPRLTYQNGGGGCPSLLLEKQSTNELSYSEQFDNAFYTKSNASISANATTSPDGTQNADKLIEDNSNNGHVVYSQPGGASKTLSFYAKAAERTWISVLSNNGNNTFFNLGNGTLGTVAATSSATITAVGDGWYRCTVYNTHPSYGFSIYLTTGNNVVEYTGNGTSGVYIWGAQLEASSYPTSYIPTTSASATRVADACYKTGISSLIGQTEGVIFWDIQVETLSASGNENILNIDNGSFGDTIYFLKTASGGITIEVYVGGTAQCSLSYSLPSVGRYKIGFAYASNDFALYVNGVSRGTDSSGSVPTCSRLQMGQGALGSSDGKINQAILFPTRLTNAELASLTTI